MTARLCSEGCTCGRHYERTAANRALISAANKGHSAYPGTGRKRRADVTYTSVHKRLRKDRGTPSLCEHCGTTTARKFEWAYTGEGHEQGAFSADLSMYIRLCTSCHLAFDGHPRTKGGDASCQSAARATATGRTFSVPRISSRVTSTTPA